jgi:uncharacterized protein
MTDRAGRTELHYAALEGNVRRITQLLDQGAHVNAADAAGWTPLHFAAQDYRVDAVATLIAAGAEIDAENRFGATPLSVAVFNSTGRGEVIRLLLDAGADPDRSNTAGVSARASAQRGSPTTTSRSTSRDAEDVGPTRRTGRRHPAVPSAMRGPGKPKHPRIITASNRVRAPSGCASGSRRGRRRCIGSG